MIPSFASSILTCVFAFVSTVTFVLVPTTAFEDGQFYNIRSTTSALIFGLQNGTSVADIPVTSQEVDISGSATKCKQNWRAVKSSVSPGFFYIRGEQGGSGSVLVWTLEGNALHHKQDLAVMDQRWGFDPLCGSTSGLIRNQRNNTLCLQDHGLHQIVTAEVCDSGNGAMLWKINPVDVPDGC